MKVEKEDYGPMDVECPVCGTMDNHARGRRGLCIWCACALGLKIGSQAFETMPQDELVHRAEEARKAAIARGTAPKTRRMQDMERRDRLEAMKARAESGDRDAVMALAKERNRIKCLEYNRERVRQRAAKRAAECKDEPNCNRPEESVPTEADRSVRIYKTSEAKRLRNRKYREAHKAEYNAYKRRAYARRKREG